MTRLHGSETRARDPFRLPVARCRAVEPGCCMRLVAACALPLNICVLFVSWTYHART